MASSSEQSLHLWRSRVIDGFARAESAIDQLLRRGNLPAKGDLLSAKVERLRKVKSPPGWSDERKGKLDLALVELAVLLPLRNDLVHAPMVVRMDGEHAVACFANPNSHCEFSRISRELPATRFQALEGKVRSLAKTLESA